MILEAIELRCTPQLALKFCRHGASSRRLAQGRAARAIFSPYSKGELESASGTSETWRGTRAKAGFIPEADWGGPSGQS